MVDLWIYGATLGERNFIERIKAPIFLEAVLTMEIMSGLELATFRQWAGVELSVSRSQNMIYFSIITMPEKSHFTIFAIQNFVQNMKNTCEFHLYCYNHVFKVN